MTCKSSDPDILLEVQKELDETNRQLVEVTQLLWQLCSGTMVINMPPDVLQWWSKNQRCRRQLNQKRLDSARRQLQHSLSLEYRAQQDARKAEAELEAALMEHKQLMEFLK